MLSNSHKGEKNLMRQRYRSQLKGVVASPETSAAICVRLRALLDQTCGELKSGGVWASYQPIGYEPDLQTLVEIDRERVWAFPRVEQDDLTFYLPESREAFRKNQWGIAEPIPERARRIEADEIDGLLIPGLAFDFSLNRLGRGRGYYDRALAWILKSTTKNPIKIGVCMDRQISPQEIPVDEHDVPMNWVVTELQTLGAMNAAVLTKTAAGSFEKGHKQ